MLDLVTGRGTCQRTEVTNSQVSETYPLPDTRSVPDSENPISIVLYVHGDQWELYAAGLGEAGTSQTRIDEVREGYPPESLYCLYHDTRSGKSGWSIELDATGTLTSEGSISYTEDQPCPPAEPPDDPEIVAYDECFQRHVSISLTRAEEDGGG